MTDEQINVAIHAALGNAIKCPRCSDPECAYNSVPNYCTDLNAMHEAEEVLLWNKGPGVWECYRNKLRGKYGEDDIHTTARQRAEVFLRTLGKWEEA
jgi:hypothetical protein